MRLTLSILILTGAIGLTACKKSDPDAAGTPGEAESPEAAAAGAAASDGKAILPGAAEIRSSLASKNYQDAVNRILTIQEAAVTPEQKVEFATLFQEVRETLQDASPTDPKAAEAMATLRAVRLGR